MFLDEGKFMKPTNISKTQDPRRKESLNLCMKMQLLGLHHGRYVNCSCFSFYVYCDLQIED